MLIPRGWTYLEQYNCSKDFHDHILPVDPTLKWFDPDEEARRTLSLKRPADFGDIIFRHRAIAAMLLPALDKIHVKTARNQNSANMASIACALERYHLANGQYPETLDALTPRFLTQVTRDVIMGEPLKYRRTDDGQFLLYSIGWDKKDDGGIATPDRLNMDLGDWVWTYSPGHS